jgi:cell division protein FtsQ
VASRKRNKKKRSRPAKKTDVRRRAFMVFLGFFVVISLVVMVRLIVQRVVFFPVKNIEIVGNRHLSNKEISRMSQLKKGVSIFSISSGSVVKRLERSPWIRRVTLRKEMPDKILIRIKEAVPAALLKEKGDYYLVRSDGEILEKQGGGEKFLPVITGKTGNRKAFREAVRFALVLREYGVDTTTNSEIVVDVPENMILKYDDTTIKVGYGAYEAKLLRYMELKDEIVRRGIPVRNIDLRYDKRVIVRTSDGGAK